MRFRLNKRQLLSENRSDCPRVETDKASWNQSELVKWGDKLDHAIGRAPFAHDARRAYGNDMVNNHRKFPRKIMGMIVDDVELDRNIQEYRAAA